MKKWVKNTPRISAPEEDTEVFIDTDIWCSDEPLKQYIDLSTDDKEEISPTRHPEVDTTTNSELFNWIYQARIVTKNLHNKELRFAIKGDSHEEYPVVTKK